MAVVRTTEEIEDQIELAVEGIEHGSKFRGMSYEDGVKYALEWVTGQSDDKPMED
jgi:hypothetical protein